MDELPSPGPSHWQVEFKFYASALEPLEEDSLSDADVTDDHWQLRTSASNLDTIECFCGVQPDPSRPGPSPGRGPARESQLEESTMTSTRIFHLPGREGGRSDSDNI
jgi:hypothetical protein